MVLYRRIHKRGATYTIQARAEVLFTPTGPIGSFNRRFSHRTLAHVKRFAPDNKRPRWGHYGLRLKDSFTATTSLQPIRLKAYFAVGSRVRHSLFVDQGTGIYAGNAPWQAAVLPPWTRGGSSLYERTWVPPGSSSPVRPVMIKGQEAQQFFEKGLHRAFRSMRMRSFQVPGDPRMDKAMTTAPPSISAPIPENYGPGSAFRASLEEWRSWRDAAFNNQELLGTANRLRERNPDNRTRQSVLRRERTAAAGGPRRNRRTLAENQRRAQASAERSKRWRERMNQEKNIRKPDPRGSGPTAIPASLQSQMRASVGGWLARRPGYTYTGKFDSSGFTVRDRAGNSHKVQWPLRISSALYDLRY